MFRGLNIQQLRLVVALLLMLFMGLAIGHWLGRRDAVEAATLEGNFEEQSAGELVAREKPEASPPGEAAPASGDQQPGGGSGAPGLIDINTAEAEELDLLPGIGPVKSQSIVRDRQANGPFRREDDLMRVSGIGEKTLEKLRPFITVSGDVPQPQTAPPASGVQNAQQQPPAPPEPVRVNVAGAERLQELKYVGPTIANRIIRDRQLNGPFRRPEDMKRVNGLGPKFVQENKHLLQFN